MNAPFIAPPNGNGHYWTPEMDEVLRRERADGKSFSEAIAAINKAFGTAMTRNAAIGRASRLAMPGRKQPPPKPKSPLKPKPATKTVMRAIPVVSARGNVTFRMKPKTVLADDAIVSTPLELGTAAVSFFDAKPCHCRWPYGDPRDLDTFRFCGEAAPDDRPYCVGHTRKARGSQAC